MPAYPAFAELHREFVAWSNEYPLISCCLFMFVACGIVGGFIALFRKR